MRGSKCFIRFVGYLPAKDREIQEYRDYIDRIQMMPRSNFEIQIRIGTFPPGLVLVPEGGIQGIIVGVDESQRVMPYKGCVRP